MKNLIFFLLGSGMLIMAGSCYYDKAELLYPNQNACDTSIVVTYSKTIVPILQQNCYSCHGGNSPSGGIAMGTYAADKAIAANGKLLGSIEHKSGYSPMPQNMAMLSTCDISKIKKWVSAGIPNN